MQKVREMFPSDIIFDSGKGSLVEVVVIAGKEKCGEFFEAVKGDVVSDD